MAKVTCPFKFPSTRVFLILLTKGMSSSSFTNFLATSLHILGLTFSVIRIGIVIWLSKDILLSLDILTFFFRLLNHIIYFGTFLFVLVRPRFVAENGVIWFGFAVALANDLAWSLVVLTLRKDVHILYNFAWLLQLGFNFVVMVGSLLAPGYFLPQSKP